MISLLIAALLIGCTVSIMGPVVAALTAALWVVLAESGLALSSSSIAVLFLVVASIPSAAFLAAALLRNLLERSSPEHRSALELLAVCLSTLIALQSGRGTMLFVSAGFLGTGRPVSEQLEVAAIAVGNCIFVGSLTALTIGVVAASAEILSAFTARAARIAVPISFPALRQILLLAALSASFDLCIGLFNAHLTPITLLRGILP